LSPSAEEVRARVPGLVDGLRRAGWLVDVDDGRIQRVADAACRDAARRRVPERGSLEQDLLLLDPRTRNAAFPVSLTGAPFELLMPSAEGRVLPVPVRPELPEDRSGVGTWHFMWAGGRRRLVLRVHDGLYNRGLAVRGVNKLLAGVGVSWRYREILAGAMPVLVLADPDGLPLRNLMALDWARPMPAGGEKSAASDAALARAGALRAHGVLHPGLGDDLVRRSFSGPRRFLDDLPDDLMGNHVAVLDGLSVLHVDSLRTFDEDRHEELANGLFRIGGDVFAGAHVTDLESTATGEGPTELDIEWGDEEYRIHFDQETGVVEVRIVHALNELLARRGRSERWHALAPVSHVADADPRSSLLISLLTPAQAEGLRAEGLVRFAQYSMDPATLPADERLRIEVI